MATPARKVHWNAFSPGFSDISSPSSNASSESFASTSSLQYINSQLVAHGFITAPGLSLDGISNSEMDRTVKCLLELLGQRMKDMSRTENLTTDVRTLSYDHERLRSMHTAASDKAANFEREMNLHKSRLQATTRTLQASEQANKQTTAELQRTRGILHAVRATHQSELKKREKDIEKMSEKWQKLADSQTKLSALGSGLKLANSRLPAGDIPKTQPFLEIAAQDAEKARAQAVAECSTLKRVILNAVNELQSVLHDMAGSDIAEPTPFTLATLFPYSAPGNSADNLASVLLSLRDSIQDIKPEPRSPPQTFDEERDQMQAVIDSLQVELEAAKAQAGSRSAETSKNLEVQVLVDKFASDPRLLGQEPDVSVDLMTVPQHDELQERLVDMRQQLEDERRKFTDATIRLGHERANLEAERQKLQEEKRSWQLEMMLSELPPTPLNGGSSLPTPEFKAPPRSPRRVPHKSPVKKSSAKTAIRTTTRVRRRSSLLASPTKKPRVEPAYETEVITQAHIPIPFKATIPISRSDERIPPAPSMSSNLLPTSFVLPPPSPQAALPPSTLPSLLSSRSLLPTLHPETPLEEGAVVQSTTPPSPSPPEVPQTPQPYLRPYPVAKPFAPRMIHAYSPARPSPLSRILRLGDSPTSPLFTDGSSSGLEALNEEDESDHPFLSPGPQLTLAQELGVPDSPPERSESPLLDKAPNLVLPRPPVPKGKTKAGSSSTTTKSKAAPGPKPSTMTSKSQGVVGLKEKENAATARHAPTTTRTTSTTSKPPPVSQPTMKPVITLATSRVRVTAKGPVGGRTDGPRRVPINEVSRARRP